MSTLAIFLLLLPSYLAQRDTAPVFILDHDRVIPRVPTEPNPFKKMQTSDFNKIIHEAVTRCKVVILFIEETFCFEDISTRDRLGTPFHHMSQRLKENRVKFIPAVAQPFKSLKNYFIPNRNHEFYLSDSSTKVQVYDGKSKYLYIYFNSYYNETRVNALRRHDLLMLELYFYVKQVARGHIVAFYTGKINPIVMDKGPTKPPKVVRQPGITISTSSALFRFIGLYSTSGTRRSSFSEVPVVGEETWRQRSLTTRMEYTEFELEFSFKFREDRWLIDYVSLLEYGEEVGRTEMRVGAPWKWSYICSEPLVLVNMRDGSAVTISQYQVQPFNNDRYIGRNGTGNQSAHCFGPAVNCGPYFNAHILAGLMVTFFCLGILTYGVITMYNCHSNDRYDDQNGKPLVIAAEAGG